MMCAAISSPRRVLSMYRTPDRSISTLRAPRSTAFATACFTLPGSSVTVRRPESSTTVCPFTCRSRISMVTGHYMSAARVDAHAIFPAARRALMARRRLHPKAIALVFALVVAAVHPGRGPVFAQADPAAAAMATGEAAYRQHKFEEAVAAFKKASELR